jgi:hypothetical protein
VSETALALEQLLVALVEHGNRDEAESLLDRELAAAPDERVDSLLELRRTLDLTRPPHRGSVFLPLPRADGRQGGLLVRVELVDGDSTPEGFDESTLATVARAMDAAWDAVRGQGPRPRLSLRFPFGALASVRGTSVWLPVFLAAVAHWGDAVLDGNVLATGSFDDDIDLLEAKVRLVDGAASELGVSELLTAARKAPAATSAKVRLLRNKEEALSRVFSFHPWHATAEVACLHVHCGTHKSEPPARFSSGGCRTLELPEQLSPEHLLDVRARVTQTLRGANAWELSVAGPVALAAWLGCVLRNHPATVRVVHRNDVWCDNRKLRRVASGAGPARALLVRCGDAVAVPIDGVEPSPAWKIVPSPESLTRHELPGVVDAVVREAAGGGAPLFVAIAGPMPLAFAIGAALQPLDDRVVFCQLDRDRYVRWFTARDARR